MNKPSTLEVLKLFAEKDDYDSLWWRCDKMELNGEIYDYTPVTFFVNCNDLFFWACSDAETIESDQDIEGLRKAFEDCEKLDRLGGCDAPLLWVCRKRKMRPQDPYYKHFQKALWPLFNECGPERSKSEQG